MTNIRYVFMLTKKEEDGTQPIQVYWSKSRPQQWSLNTVLVIPQFQGQGFSKFSKFMIAVSYLIIKEAEEVGSPEKPMAGFKH